jgi:hypothetical protein
MIASTQTERTSDSLMVMICLCTGNQLVSASAFCVFNNKRTDLLTKTGFKIVFLMNLRHFQ